MAPFFSPLVENLFMKYANNTLRVKYGEVGIKRKLIFSEALIISHESRGCVETIFSNRTSWRFKQTATILNPILATLLGGKIFA